MQFSTDLCAGGWSWCIRRARCCAAAATAACLLKVGRAKALPGDSRGCMCASTITQCCQGALPSCFQSPALPPCQPTSLAPPSGCPAPPMLQRGWRPTGTGTRGRRNACASLATTTPGATGKRVTAQFVVSGLGCAPHPCPASMWGTNCAYLCNCMQEEWRINASAGAADRRAGAALGFRCLPRPNSLGECPGC